MATNPKTPVAAFVLTDSEQQLAVAIQTHVKGAASLISQVRVAIEARFGAGSAPIHQAEYAAWSKAMGEAVGAENKRAWAVLATTAKGARALIDKKGEDISAKRKAANSVREATQQADSKKRAASEPKMTVLAAIHHLRDFAGKSLNKKELVTFDALCLRLSDTYKLMTSGKH